MAEYCSSCSCVMGFLSEDLEPGEICERCGAKATPTGSGWLKIGIVLIVLALLVLFQLFLSPVKAQSRLLMANSLAEAKSIADTVAKGYAAGYQYYRTDTMPEHGLAVVRYRSKNQPEEKLDVVFYYFPNQPLYLKSFAGGFADVMPFYTRFKPMGNSQAIKQNLFDRCFVKTDTGKREIYLHSEDDRWEIDIESQ